MSAVTDELDRLADKRYRAAAETQNSNEERTDASVHNEARGAQIIQTNALSTPVFVVLVVALFIAALVSAGALGVAFNANYAAQMAEREARLALSHADNAANELKVMKEVRANDVQR